ncbi:MAG: caspase family protein [Pseudomonadota bacterium]|nr:caspase family protein [Pseudomonadota bacterium]
MISLLASLAVAGVVAVQPGANTSTFAPRRVAVVIGVQQYADPALQGLRFATKDARDLGAALGSADVGGFDRVTVIEGASATTRDALRIALAAATADLQRDDTFLLYLSGHGTLTLDPVEGSRLWFLPSDARLEAPAETGVAVTDLEELVNELPARRRVLILDTCHNGRSGSKSSLSGTTSRQIQGLRGEPPAPRGDREVSESEARLFAAQYYQPAMEDPDLQNGVYTHFLLESLTDARRDADLDRDGLVDVSEAHEYARDHTIAYTGGLQVPRAEYRIVGREEIYLSGRAAERTGAEQALISAYDQVLNRARLLVNGIPRGELPGLYAVEPGPQTIEVQTADGRTIVKDRVNLDAGSRLGLEDLVQGREPAVEVLVGASVQAGTAFVHPVQASLGVVWVRPVKLPPPLRPDLHLGVEFADGALPEGSVGSSGELSAGATFAVDLGPVWIGPGVDLRVPLRRNGDTGALESALTGAALASIGGGVPLGRDLALELRVDGELLPFPTVYGTDLVYGATVRAGVRFGR